MKRTTVFLEEDVQAELAALARRRGKPVATLVREALRRYVKSAGRRNTGLRFVAIGRSGKRDTAERHEELLFQDLRPGRARRDRAAARESSRKS
jgi:predicted transcriptional regulator